MRLVTRPDLDGLACAVILGQHHKIDELLLIEPQLITDQKVEIRPDDVVANLPYAPGCGMWFDHHMLTASNAKPPPGFMGKYRVAPSAAQLVWEFYGEDPDWRQMIDETNRLDSAQLSTRDILQPEGFILLGFTLDPRSGLGPSESYFKQCLRWLQTMTIDEILMKPEVHLRVIKMFEQNEEFAWTLMDSSRLDDNVIVTDFRRVKDPPAGNRFLIYTLFPEGNVSMLVQWGKNRENVKLSVGHSILNRTCKTSVGELMSNYGGGGHHGAGSTPLQLMEADQRIFEIVDILRRNG